jgi:phenylalanyl-tRNA synthetase beta chain
MRVPLSWIKDFVDTDLPVEELARLLTMAGLEVESIELVGLPFPSSDKHGFKITGLSWSPEAIVVAQVDEVMPHPNADRLVLCRLQDGIKEHVVLTGAPNLFPYKGLGPLSQPLKVAYAREGARLYDGHQPGQVLTTLKRTKIRGVESYSMVCSEKELGVSEEHEGVIFLDSDAPTGKPLVDYMGDAVFEIKILPNIIQDACMFGVAREIAAMTGKPLHPPANRVQADGPAIAGKAAIQINKPELNPRFVLGLIEGVSLKTSPYWVQRRLRLAGMRPINAVVDATNYVMLELNQPLHAFDYDVLLARAGGQAPTIITRTAQPGERLITLDDVDRTLDPFSMLVCDTKGSLSIAGVMGGQESEISNATRNVLLEGASWNFINIRKTVAAQHLQSEAAFRFSRGIHPALAPWGVTLCLEYMRQWSGGLVSQGLIDHYPLPAVDPEVSLTADDVERGLGIRLPIEQIAGILEKLSFAVKVKGQTIQAKTPSYRLDIGEGVIGKANLLEEIARIFGYDQVPATRLSDELPPQRNNPALESEERVRDILVSLGMQEVITYRLTTPEREARLLQPGAAQDERPYIRLKNPITPERAVMRHSLLSSIIEIIERNYRLRDHLTLFEIGPVFLPVDGQTLPDEPRRLAIAITGLRQAPDWKKTGAVTYDFFDLKGIIEALFESLHISGLSYAPVSHPVYHPGKCARVMAGETYLGVFGELHPLVKERLDLTSASVLAAELDLEALLDKIQTRFTVRPVPAYPPVLEDIAIIVDEDQPAGEVEDAIWQAGGKMLSGVRLFDIFKGEQVGAGKKSLAYNLTYQAYDRTLTDQEATQIRKRVVRQLEQSFNAKLRSD